MPRTFCFLVFSTLALIPFGCSAPPEPASLTKDQTSVAEIRELTWRRFKVMDSDWYDTASVAHKIDLSKLPLESTNKRINMVLHCWGNIMAKLHAPTGDAAWDEHRSIKWHDRYRKMAAFGLVSLVEPYSGTSSLPSGAHQAGMLYKWVARVAYVTRKRVYAKVTPEFSKMLEDERSFKQSWLDTGDGHKDPLREFIRDEKCDPDKYEIRSWREKRRKFSFQCVLAFPKHGADGPHFVDIDIDEWNPLADGIAFVAHNTVQRFFRKTNHVRIRTEPGFTRQPEVSYNLELLSYP